MQVVDDERDDELITWKVIVHKEDGVNAKDSQHIYLVDHAWTFRSDNARQMLLQHPNLLERMANLFELDHATTKYFLPDYQKYLSKVFDKNSRKVFQCNNIKTCHHNISEGLYLKCFYG